MNPQTLHDAWLVVTVIATLGIGGIATFLWTTFRRSAHRWFFWMIAMVLTSVAVEHVSAEIKNLYATDVPASLTIAGQWLIGRMQEAIVATVVLGYMIFGRNGRVKSTKT